MTPYRGEIEDAAKAAKLDPNVVEALVLQESSGNADAFRFEPMFWARYLRDKPEYASAIPRRVSSSYGLTQIMYPVACENGFVGQPEMLFVPQINLHWGCRHLSRLVAWAEGDVDTALAAYNAGRGGASGVAGRAYAAKVRAKLVQVLLERRGVH